MALKKFMAGMAAMALSATMVMSASAESVIEVNETEENYTASYSNCFGPMPDSEDEDSQDYIDARTFTKDQDLTCKVEFERTEGWADQPESQQYVNLAPGRSNGWKKFGDSQGMNCLQVDFIKANDVATGKVKGYSMDGEAVVNDKTKKTEPVILKLDGFINITDKNVNEVEFTIPKDEVNKLIEEANAEDSWDGIIIQKNTFVKINKVTLSQDGVTLASTYEKNKKGDSKADSSKAEESKAEDTKAESKAESKADDNSKAEESKDGLSTGAIAGIVAGALIVVVGAIVIVTKKKK